MLNKAAISPSAANVPVLVVVKKPLRLRESLDQVKTYLFFKRIIDIAFSFGFIVLVMSWLAPIVMLLIRLDSGGSIFFLQKRIGRGGKSFTCYKFRTMVANKQVDEQAAGERDERITRLGWFLRKSNIDEFPQFFNVLLGSMSLVGPRPHMYADCNKFSRLLPGYKFRNMVKPGITGLAQIKGFHGVVSNSYSILMRYHWDEYYIKHISLRMDIMIITKTAVQRIGALMQYLSERSGPRRWPGL